MEGHHHHEHQIRMEHLNRAFYIGIVVNFAFVVIEAVYGFLYHSLSLLSDAGHNLSDVASLALSLFAFKLLKKKATDDYTYGFRKATVLASLINAVILIVAVGFIFYEAVERFLHPQPLQGKVMAFVAFVGILVNGFTAWLFMKDQKTDLNVKGAYLHMLADTLVSVAVVIGGSIIVFTDWYWLDPLLSILVGVVILVGTWNLLTQSLRLSMDGVPENISIENIRSEILKIPGVLDMQHIHVWALSTTENALTAHIRISPELSRGQEEDLKNTVKHRLEHLHIQHSTIETYCCEKVFHDEI